MEKLPINNPNNKDVVLVVFRLIMPTPSRSPRITAKPLF